MNLLSYCHAVIEGAIKANGNASKEECIDTPVMERAAPVITKKQECATIDADEGAASIKPEERQEHQLQGLMLMSRSLPVSMTMRMVQ